jgi:DNA replication protein DnaC
MTTMIEEIDQLLANLKLKRMRDIVRRELERSAKTGCAPDEVLARLLREQWQYQQERSLANRLESARIPERWDLETFPFARQPGVNAAQVRQLASLDFVASGTNIVLIGDTGVGKTGIGTGLLLTALRSGQSGRFVKAQDLFEEMYASLADRTTRRVLESLARISVLCIDELGYLTIRPEQANTFFKLMDMRYTAHKPTIITTNLGYDDWAHVLGHAQMTAALLGRLRHRCITLEIRGPSLRTPMA